jgi:dienelactone hydrolase
MRRVALAALALLVAACGGGSDDAATPTRTPTATATSTPSAPLAREVTFEASDGEPVTALFTPAGARAPAVVLLHEIHGRPEQWDDLVPDLHAAGFATLAYESRGSPVEKDRCSSPTKPSPRPSTACSAAPCARRRSARTARVTASCS